MVERSESIPVGEDLLVEAINSFRRNKLLFFSVAFLPIVVATAVAFLQTPVYRADVLLAVVEDESGGGLAGAVGGQFAGLASLAGIDLSSNSRKNEYLANLVSRGFSRGFIQEEEMLQILFEDDWNSEKNEWAVESDDEIPTLSDAYKVFNEEVRFVSEDPESGLVTLSIFWHDPSLAAYWANELVRKVNTRLRDDAIDEARNSLAYLDEELKKTNVVELRRTIYSVVEQQINRIMIASVRDEYAFRVIDPAIVPDSDKFVRPKRLLLIVAGLLIGLVLGLLAVLLRDYYPRIANRLGT